MRQQQDGVILFFSTQDSFLCSDRVPRYHTRYTELGNKQSRTQSNACSRVRVGIGGINWTVKHV